MKRPGEADPAIHHTIEGGRPLFHAMDSAMTREAPSSSETSAEMYWNRWVGEGAAACISASADSSLPTFLATMMILAPFFASWIAALFPIPSEAPVKRTVLPLTSNLFLLKRPMIVGARRRIGRTRETVQMAGREMGRKSMVKRI